MGDFLKFDLIVAPPALLPVEDPDFKFYFLVLTL